MLRTFRRPLALLVLVLLTGAGTAQALPVVEGPQEARFQNPLTLVWDWMASLFDKVLDPNDPLNTNGGLDSTSSGSDVRSFIDPNGNS